MRDSDLADLDLPPAAQTWKGFLTTLSPGGSFVPSPATLRAVGHLIMERILGSPEVAQHLAGVERRAERENRTVRLLIEVDEEDPLLACLPFELAFDGDRFYFKRSGRTSFRVAPHSEARNLRLGRGSQVLIATAHSDVSPQPDKDSLERHAAAVIKAVRKAGFKAERLPNATREDLRKALHSGPVVDLLYIVCHGIEDPDHSGQLVLRDGSLFGEDLASWLEVAVEKKRPVQAVILCACSSALPSVGEGTLGMAQYLVRPGRALAALGFRGPILVDWALQWSERLFGRLGQGDSLEDAFSKARSDEPDSEPQWVLPVLYARRRDPDAQDQEARPTAGPGGRPRPAPPPLPRRPRPYFTGRAKDLQILRDWAQTPGALQITAVQGWGGIGKSELATVLAHEERAAGRFVIWRDRPGRDVRDAQVALIRVCEPDFRPTQSIPEEELTWKIHRLLGPYEGLLVLDDITDPSVVDKLLPGSGWNVLITTRIQGLLAGAFEVDLQPLEKDDALRLLAQVAWNAKEPPETERPAAEQLVERLGCLPLALEVAGATLRDLVPAEEYLQSLDLNEGIAATELAKVEATLLRTLTDLEEDDEKAFLALGILPGSGASAEAVADTLGQPRPRVTRRLDRLVRYSLAMWSPETQRYALHPLLYRAAKERAKHSKILNELHAGAARAINKLAQWIREPREAALVSDRWNRYHDFFEAIDLAPWRAGAPGRSQVEAALRHLGDLLPQEKPLQPKTLSPLSVSEPSEIGAPPKSGFAIQIPSLEESWAPPSSHDEAALLKERGDVFVREGNLSLAAESYDQALALYQAAGSRSGQATVLRSRGDLLALRAELDSASQDYNQALALFQAIADRLGQADVLVARGDLSRHRRDFSRASLDYDAGLALYRALGSSRGQANVLLARGELRRMSADLAGASADYDEALALYDAIGNRLGRANVLKARGDLHRSSGDLERAATDYSQARGLFGELSQRQGLADTLQAFGDLERGRSHLPQARRWYEEALVIYRQLQDSTNIGNVLSELARISLLGGDTDAAQAFAVEARSVSIPSENAYATGLADSILLDKSINPYRGLASYRSEHAELFFGRGAATRRLLGHVRRKRLSVLVGPSGSGKSSLVQAGLLPRLKARHRQRRGKAIGWVVTPPLRIVKDPFIALHAVLTEAGGPPLPPAAGLDAATAAGWAGAWAASHPCERLLLLVDQAEELVTQVAPPQVATGFLRCIEALLWAGDGRVRVLLIVRSDDEFRLSDGPLASLWNEGRFVVPPLTREELRQVIEGPATRRGLSFADPWLVDRLVDEVFGMSGGLPLLSYFLNRLYLAYLKAGRQDRVLTTRDLRAIGGGPMDPEEAVNPVGLFRLLREQSSEFVADIAVVLGIGAYEPAVGPLKTPVPDAEAVAALLASRFGYEVILRRDREVTLAGLRTLLHDELPKRVPEASRLLFFFAGHGTLLDSTELEDAQGYLVPQDATHSIETHLPMLELSEALARLPCRHLLAVLDCSFAGTFRWPSKWPVSSPTPARRRDGKSRMDLPFPGPEESLYEERYRHWVRHPARWALASAAHDQLALDALGYRRGQAGSHSPFTAALLDGLAGEAGRPGGGNGFVTLAELYAFVLDRLAPHQSPLLVPLPGQTRGQFVFRDLHRAQLLVSAEEEVHLDASQNPYRGLKPYRAEDSELFFGREDATRQLLRRVRRHRLTVLVGPSGSGKSSLLHAGLLPLLRARRQRRPQAGWQAPAPMRVDGDPFVALHEILVAAGDPPPPSAAELRDNLLAVRAWGSAWVASHPCERLLVVIDQAEELVTRVPPSGAEKPGGLPAASADFLSCLRALLEAGAGRLRVLVAARSHLEPDLDLAQVWGTGRFVMPPLSQEELRQIIERPATRRALYFDDPRLVDRLAEEVFRMPAGLPLLSHFLSTLYLAYLRAGRQDRLLTVRDLQTISGSFTELDKDTTHVGLVHVLRELVDRAISDLPDENHHRTLWRVFLRMVHISDNRPTLRQVPLSELDYPQSGENDRVAEVLRRLVDQEYLLVINITPSDSGFVEPAHDELLVSWPDLVRRIDEARVFLPIHRRLGETATGWDRLGRRRRDLDLRFLKLVEMSSLPEDWLNRQETQYVAAARRKRRNQTTLKWALAVVATLLVIHYAMLLFRN